MSKPSARKRYDAVRAERPALFANPPGAAYEILLSPAQVAQAEADEAKRLRQRGQPESWSRSGVVYEDPYQMLVRDAVRRPDGQLGTYVRVISATGATGAAVLPVLGEDVVLIRHFRHATRSEHLEIPRGFGEPGSSAADQARRELTEETGAIAADLIALGGIHSNTGASGDLVELFLARVHQIGDPETAEGISSIELVKAPALARMVATGQITDAFTIAAWTRASLRGLLPGHGSGTGGRV